LSKKDSQHLNELKKLLDDAGGDQIFACIQDLISNGLSLSRFSKGEMMPTRQDITQFLAAWFRHINVSPDACRDWLIKYCGDVLSAISSSSLSQIRHSTRSNVKYIYRAEVPFDCGCENNAFRAACTRECPVYEEMQIRSRKPKERGTSRLCELEPRPKVNSAEIAILPVKELYKEQFENGLKLIEVSLRQGLAKKEIIVLLNDRGFKTRTGRTWTNPILSSEIRRRNWEQLGKSANSTYGPDALSGDHGRSVSSLKVKELYSEQFERALNLVEESLRKGLDRKKIVSLLNDRGLKTRTGRMWTIQGLRLEIQKNNLTEP